MVKLLALDLDGTCLNWNNKISSKTMAALKKAAQQGVEIIFATGRSYASIPYQLKKERFFRYVISSNGAAITEHSTNRVIFHSYIPLYTALSILKRARKMRFGLTIHIDSKHVLESTKLKFLGKFLYGKDSNNAIKVKDIIQYISKIGERIEEIHLFYFRKNKRKMINKLLQEFPQLYSPQGHFYFEMVTGETTKGNALLWLTNRLGLTKQEVACVGDGENDISMFEQAGLCYAVENAKECLKRLADYVVPTNNEDGVVDVIKSILEIRGENKS